MKKDIILAGVGGQGTLSIAAIIAKAAVKMGLSVRQSEVHGMAQRGGAVLAHLRIADADIASDLVPQGAGDLIISMEPLESLRYAAWLAPDGALVTAEEPFMNINDYPEIETIRAIIRRFPKYRIIGAERLAKDAGLPKAANVVMAGAAASFLPLPDDALEAAIADMFAAKGATALEANKKAFKLGKDAAL
ncbi:MAG: indolepyruvate oxidoreductase subunit beta [Treponema sp.]|jgi:indolepyruvate ferredoxin oxidoreductase beta subunit|nr:indolepyruvate oxidoreductase subunit beta [Treponema sp.]